MIAKNRQRALLTPVLQAAAAIELGHDYSHNYGKLRRSLIRLEQVHADSLEMRRAQARGLRALGIVARQLGQHPHVVSGHLRRSFRLYLAIGEIRPAFSSLLGQSLALRFAEPTLAARVLRQGEQFTRDYPQDKIRWLVQLAGVMRSEKAGVKAIDLHRRTINPLLGDVECHPVERYSVATSWAAALIENVVCLDEAYDAIATNLDTRISDVDAVAIYDRHVQAAKLFTLSADFSLAEEHLRDAEALCISNGYNPVQLIRARRHLEACQ